MINIKVDQYQLEVNLTLKRDGKMLYNTQATSNSHSIKELFHDVLEAIEYGFGGISSSYSDTVSPEEILRLTHEEIRKLEEKYGIHYNKFTRDH